MNQIPFYPDHYLQSTSKDIQTILSTTMELAVRCAQEYDRNLQILYFLDDIPERDRLKLFSYLQLPLVSWKIFSFMKRKMTPVTMDRLKANLRYLFQQNHWDVVVNIRYNTETYTLYIDIIPEELNPEILKIRPFLQKYISYLVSPFIDLRIQIPIYRTLGTLGHHRLNEHQKLIDIMTE